MIVAVGVPVSVPVGVMVGVCDAVGVKVASSGLNAVGVVTDFTSAVAPVMGTNLVPVASGLVVSSPPSPKLNEPPGEPSTTITTPMMMEARMVAAARIFCSLASSYMGFRG